MSQRALLELKGVSKNFGAVEALREVDFRGSFWRSNGPGG